MGIFVVCSCVLLLIGMCKIFGWVYEFLFVSRFYFCWLACEFLLVGRVYCCRLALCIVEDWWCCWLTVCIVGWLCNSLFGLRILFGWSCVFFLIGRLNCCCWPCVIVIVWLCTLLFIRLCIFVVWPGVVIAWPLVLLVSRA